MDQTVPVCVLILHMETDVKESVNVTKTAVMSLQDVDLLQQANTPSYMYQAANPRII